MEPQYGQLCVTPLIAPMNRTSVPSSTFGADDVGEDGLLAGFLLAIRRLLVHGP